MKYHTLENGITINQKYITYIDTVGPTTGPAAFGTYEYHIGIVGSLKPITVVFSTKEKAEESRSHLYWKWIDSLRTY